MLALTLTLACGSFHVVRDRQGLVQRCGQNAGGRGRGLYSGGSLSCAVSRDLGRAVGRAVGHALARSRACDWLTVMRKGNDKGNG